MMAKSLCACTIVSRVVKSIHNQNYLMENITFEVHHITLTSPRNMFASILKVFWFFLLFIFFAYFSFKYIMHGHIREKKIPNYVSLNILILHFAMQVLHLTKHDFYELHIDVLWLTSVGGVFRRQHYVRGVKTETRL